MVDVVVDRVVQANKFDGTVSADSPRYLNTGPVAWEKDVGWKISAGALLHPRRILQRIHLSYLEPCSNFRAVAGVALCFILDRAHSLPPTSHKSWHET